MSNNLSTSFEAWRVILGVLLDIQDGPIKREQVETFIDDLEDILDHAESVPKTRIVRAMNDLGDRVSEFCTAHGASAKQATRRQNYN